MGARILETLFMCSSPFLCRSNKLGSFSLCGYARKFLPALALIVGSACTKSAPEHPPAALQQIETTNKEALTGVKQGSFSAVADAWVGSGSAQRENSNSGSFSALKADNTTHTLLRFSESAVASWLGSGVLQSARLEFVVTAAPQGSFSTPVHKMTQTWTELGATWNCPDDLNLSNTVPDCGAGWNLSNGTAYVATATSAPNHAGVQANGIISMDVTADVASFLAAPSSNYGWLVKGLSVAVDALQLKSREAAGFAPQLVVVADFTGCVPLTNCSTLAPIDCGDVFDGCGSLINCGSCVVPEVCGGGGLANQCGCTSSNCTAELRSLTPSADTFVQEAQQNQTGTPPDQLHIGVSGARRTLLRFDEMALKQAVGGGAPVSSSLRLYVNPGTVSGNTPHDVEVHKMQQSWSEQNATWACADGTSSNCAFPDQWNMEAIGDQPFMASDWVSFDFNTSGWVSFNVNSDVQSFAANPSNNHGWIIKNSGQDYDAGGGGGGGGSSGVNAEFASREAGPNPPELNLVVDFSSCGNDCDGDGISNGSDFCPMVYDPTNADTDSDGVGDACDACVNDSGNDSDGDGLCDSSDNCPGDVNAGQLERDGDGVGDICDNCVGVANSNQANVDGDALGDVCDVCPNDPLNPDADTDGVCDDIDNCLGIANPTQGDFDGDGLGDFCDDDNDGDGTPNVSDNCLMLANPGQEDADGDGIGDACDPCTDADGDSYCAGVGAGLDCDDSNVHAAPGNTEICANSIDDDCDGGIDNATGGCGLSPDPSFYTNGLPAVPYNPFHAFEQAFDTLQQGGDDCSVVDRAPSSHLTAMHGAFDVTPSGAAQYTIPIQVPPGRRGMQPRLALVYNSRGRDGIMGRGWSLAGLSQINRCNKTVAQHGVAKGYEFTDEDTLCLDGQPLVESDATACAGNEKAFHTVANPFDLICAEWGGASVEYISYVKVFRNGGTIATYRPRSKLTSGYYNLGLVDTTPGEEGGELPVAWPLLKEEDRQGNTIEYEYESSDVLNAEVTPGPPFPAPPLDNGTDPGFAVSAIHYTSHGTTQGQRSVTFEYAVRTDFLKHYTKGAMSETRYRLNVIRTQDPCGPSMYYIMGYNTQGHLQIKTRLASVQKCDGTGVCMQPTTFEWEDESSLSYTRMVFPVIDQTVANNNLTFDKFSPGPARFDPPSELLGVGIPYPDLVQPFVADTRALGSGRLFVPENVSFLQNLPDWRRQWFAFEADGMGGLSAVPALVEAAADTIVVPADISGDRQKELVVLNLGGFDLEEAGTRDAHLRVEYDPFPAGNPGTGLHATERILNHIVGDFDGDGAEEIMLKDWSTGGFSMFTNGIFQPVEFGYGSLSKSMNSSLAADFDGDGRDEILYYNSDGLRLIETDTDNSLLSWQLYTLLMPFTPEGIKTLDFNGDGLTDLMVREGQDWHVWLATGDLANVFVEVGVISGATVGSAELMITDLDSDGASDVLFAHSGSSPCWVYYFDNNGVSFRTVDLFPVPGESTHNFAAPFSFVDLDDDGRHEIVASDNGAAAIYKRDAGIGGKIVGFRSGLNPASAGAPPDVKVEYTWSTRKSVYDRNPTNASAETFVPAMFLVSKVEHNTGELEPGTVAARSYYYRHAVRGLPGDEFLGFAVTSSYDFETGVRRTTVYDTTPFVQQVVYNETELPTGAGKAQRISTTIELENRSLNSGRSYFLFPRKTTNLIQEVSYTTSSPPAPPDNNSLNVYPHTTQTAFRVTTERDFDAYGNELWKERTAQSYVWDGAALPDPAILLGDLENEAWLLELAQLESVGSYQRVDNEYTSDLSNWLIGQLDSSTIVERSALCELVDPRPGSTPFPGRHPNVAAPSWYNDWVVAGGAGCPPGGEGQVQTSLTYYTDSVRLGLPETITAHGEALDGSEDRVTTYDYDSFGNLFSASVQGVVDAIGTIDIRTSTLSHDPQENIFPITSTNALGHVISTVFDRGFGVPIAVKHADGVVETNRVDGFGVSVEQGIAGGSVQRTSIVAAATEDPDTIAYRLIGESLGAGTATTLVDILGRSSESKTTGFGNTEIFQDIVYNKQGRVGQVDIPRYTSDPTDEEIITAYDGLGRIIAVQGRDGTGVTSYQGMVTTNTDAHGQLWHQVLNADGEVFASIDPGALDHTGVSRQHVNRFCMGAFGNPIRLLDAAGSETGGSDADAANITIVEYDILGQRTMLHDPDSGVQRFEYNAFGELIKETDADLQDTIYTLDRLGRVTEAHVAGIGSSHFVWDVGAGAGIGKIASTAGLLGGHQEVYGYDSFGRLSTAELHLNPPSTAPLTVSDYSASFAYDAIGRIKEVNYPQTGSAEAVGISYEYDDTTGLPTKMIDQTGLVIWQAMGYSAEGRVTTERYGNGVETTFGYHQRSGRLLNVDSKRDAEGGPFRQYSYTYDLLGRLESRRALSGVGVNESELFYENAVYDALGRLTTVNDANSGAAKLQLSYDCIGNIRFKDDVGVYNYDSAKPHAVTAAGAQTFDYNAKGEMKDRDGDVYSYTPFGKLRVAAAPSGGTVGFEYNADTELVLRREETQDTVYFMGRLSRIELSGSSIDLHHAVMHPGGRVLGELQTTADVGGLSRRYHFFDHLGSVTEVLDQSGALIEQYTYDAFGKRNVEVGPGAMCGMSYTGHEYDGELNLLNMIGRHYDPTIGRFLQPDPIMQAPDFSQSPNRYSYVFNSPLSLVDPSGFTAEPIEISEVETGSEYNIDPLTVKSVKDGLKWLRKHKGKVVDGLKKAGKAIGRVFKRLFGGGPERRGTNGIDLGGGDAAHGNSSGGNLFGGAASASQAAGPNFVDSAGDALGTLGNILAPQDEIDFGLLMSTQLDGPAPGPADAVAGIVYASRFRRVQRTVNLLRRTERVAPGAAKAITDAAAGKGAKFFKQFAKRNPFGQSTRQLGEFTEFGVNVPGRVPGSYTRWVKVVNQEGRTIRLYHDTFDATGKFIHRGVKVPGPARHVP